ncbi:hypothetical protein CDS [Bradyrhizobium sp.]|nr:hypothetical protein CDS [Bradyrhizobium sp.]
MLLRQFHGSSSCFDLLFSLVMAGLDPAIHVFAPRSREERGCPGQARA